MDDQHSAEETRKQNGGTAPDTPMASPETEIRGKAFDFAADATKQLIAVATGIITATAVFSKDLDLAARVAALVSWIILTGSVLFGLGALLSMTGNLHNSIASRVAPTLDKGIHFFSAWQVGTFLAGIIAVLVFGFFAVSVKSAPDKPTTINCVVPNPPSPLVIEIPERSPKAQASKKTGRKTK